MKPNKNSKSLSELHFYNNFVAGEYLKISNKLYTVYCVANNRVDAYHVEYIYILCDIHGKKIYFDSETKAELFPVK